MGRGLVTCVGAFLRGRPGRCPGAIFLFRRFRKVSDRTSSSLTVWVNSLVLVCYGLVCQGSSHLSLPLLFPSQDAAKDSLPFSSCSSRQASHRPPQNHRSRLCLLPKIFQNQCLSSIIIKMQQESRKSIKANDKAKDNKELQEKYDTFMSFLSTLKKPTKSDDFDDYCENSITMIDELLPGNNRQITAFVPAYIRCHFRNMTQMDIQNLSCKFVATMNATFYLGMYESNNEEEKKTVRAFGEFLNDLLHDKLKITFQNDFVLNIQDDLSTNVSDSDRTIRSVMTEYSSNGITRIYTHFIVTRQFKFGLRSDILFFPLEQNDLDLVTTLNPIKLALSDNTKVIVRFNCMNIQMPKQDFLKDKGLKVSSVGNSHLQFNLKNLYMQENDGKQLTPEIMESQFQSNKNNSFFRSVKISFPLRANSTEFGYYNLIQKEIQIHYTRERQHRLDENFYQRLKNCLFCRKKLANYKDYQGNGHVAVPQDDSRQAQQGIDSEDRSLEDSYCNAIMRIPMLKASLGTIIQLCIPIYFLSFLTIVEFLYSRSSSGDIIRGQKIGSSTLIVATYISFIYAMRSVIPPTPSWSIFQVAVCILAATSLLPIIESIYASDYQTIDNPFLTVNGLFLAAFIIDAFLCMLIVVMLIVIKFFKDRKTKRHRLQNVTMDDLLSHLTKKYFFVWRNAHCYNFMRRRMDKVIERNSKIIVYFERWRTQGKK